MKENEQSYIILLSVDVINAIEKITNLRIAIDSNNCYKNRYYVI